MQVELKEFANKLSEKIQEAASRAEEESRAASDSSFASGQAVGLLRAAKLLWMTVCEEQG